jgi:hypothetical protein
VGEFHWYVGAYRLSFEDFTKGGESGPLCKDEPADASMFRVVFKSNLTMSMADDLFNRVIELIDHWKGEVKDAEDTFQLDVAPDKRDTFKNQKQGKMSMSVREAMAVKRRVSMTSARGSFRIPTANGHAAC